MPSAHSSPVRLPQPSLFRQGLGRLQLLFTIYAATSPTPLPSAGLQISPEIRYQSELYLPIDQIRRLFYRYYRASLHHTPLVVSTPFHEALSWADCFSQLPDWCQQTANPALLLQRLLADADLHERFIYASFLPSRYNGPGFDRYPAQAVWLQTWFAAMARRAGRPAVRCLDAACGSGEGTWELAEAAAETGFASGQVHLDGWTLDPLEVYAAANRYLPHLPQRQAAYLRRTDSFAARGWRNCLSFRAVDLLCDGWPEGSFDLILCNGLLGGPMLYEPAAVSRVVAGLAARLQPGGRLLAANRFHGGWVKRLTGEQLSDLFKKAGLEVEQAGEGVVGSRRG